jgi:hypothetical protein
VAVGLVGFRNRHDLALGRAQACPQEAVPLACRDRLVGIQARDRIAGFALIGSQINAKQARRAGPALRQGGQVGNDMPVIHQHGIAAGPVIGRECHENVLPDGLFSARSCIGLKPDRYEIG